METSRRDMPASRRQEVWDHWPVYWSAIWVGALAAVATGLIFGLVGIALGAHQLSPDQGGANPTNFTLGTLAFSVFGAFLSFVVGGWVAGEIAGLRRSETAMLHGAIVWLVAVPRLMAFAALGAGGFFGTWMSGLGGSRSGRRRARRRLGAGGSG